MTKLADVLVEGYAALRDRHGFIVMVRPDVGGWEVTLAQKGCHPHFQECFDVLDDVLSLFAPTCSWDAVPPSTRAYLTPLGLPPKRTSRFGGVRCRMSWEQQERFWQKVDKQIDAEEHGGRGCWLWTGNRNSTSGFGMARVDGGRVLAHRLSFELAYGVLDARKYVLHNPLFCSNKLCVNPTHLMLSERRRVSVEMLIATGLPAEFLAS